MITNDNMLSFVIICYQAVIRLLSFVIRLLSGRYQAVIRALSGRYQGVIGPLSGRYQVVIRSLSCRYQVVIRGIESGRPLVHYGERTTAW